MGKALRVTEAPGLVMQNRLLRPIRIIVYIILLQVLLQAAPASSPTGVSCVLGSQYPASSGPAPGLQVAHQPAPRPRVWWWCRGPTCTMGKHRSLRPSTSSSTWRYLVSCTASCRALGGSSSSNQHLH